MTDTRQKNVRWKLEPDRDDLFTWDQVKVAVLMDIRDELQTLNRLLHCPNFVSIPRKLDAIHKKLPARKKKPTRSARKP